MLEHASFPSTNLFRLFSPFCPVLPRWLNVVVRTSKLLGLIPPGVSNQQRPVKLHKDVLDLLLGLLVDVLLVVGNQGLGQSLSDSIHLASVAATLDTDPDVNIGKPVLAQEQDGLLQLEAQGLRLDKLQSPC